MSFHTASKINLVKNARNRFSISGKNWNGRDLI